MTFDEILTREGIRKTLAKYTVSGDRLRIDDFLSVFTDDATFESEGVPEQDAFRFVGREQIGEWIGRWARGPQVEDAKVSAASFIRHHLSTCHIEPISDSLANVRTYWTAYTDIGPDHCGHYIDKFRQTDGQWLIAHRKVRLDWRSDQSLYFSAIERTRV